MSRPEEDPREGRRSQKGSKHPNVLEESPEVVPPGHKMSRYPKKNEEDPRKDQDPKKDPSAPNVREESPEVVPPGEKSPGRDVEIPVKNPRG